MRRRSTRWARWLGWTAVFTVVLSVWGVSLFPQSPLASLLWQHTPLRVLDGAVVFWAVILGLAALAFGIGVRLADWSWVTGVLVASVLQTYIVAAVLPWPPESGQAGLVLVILLFLHLVMIVPAAAAGVWWSKRRRAADTE